MLIKRITKSFWGFAIIGFLFTCCEKMDGPDPYPCIHYYNQLAMTNQTTQPVITLDSLKKLVITEDSVKVNVMVDTIEVQNTLSIASIGKIFFVSNTNLP
jgi:hypothetical protein